MKRIIITGFISLCLLTACTAENSNKEQQLPVSTIQTQQNEAPSQNQTDHDDIPTNAEEAMAFLEKAVEITSTLETVSFSSLVNNTTYLNDLDEPENSIFNEYKHTYTGVIQRSPKLAYITTLTDQSSGTLVNGEIDMYDESTRIVSTNTEYFDPELGWFSVSGDYSYGGVASIDEQPYISHDDVDSSFKTLEHIDAFMQLFMSYPNQLSIYKNKLEDIDGEIKLDDAIVVELNLTNEQYFEHLNMLESNLFTGTYREGEMDSNELYFVEVEELRDLHLTLSFDQSYNLIQLTVFHTYNGLEDYVGVNRNDYITTHYSIFFSDHNLPYTHSIPESVILNADYN